MFNVGQKVECVKIPKGESDGAAAPRVGEKFTVIWSALVLGEPMIDLHEIPYPEVDGWYRGIPAKYFRAIVERKTSIAIFTEMLNPLKVEA